MKRVIIISITMSLLLAMLLLYVISRQDNRVEAQPLVVESPRQAKQVIGESLSTTPTPPEEAQSDEEDVLTAKTSQSPEEFYRQPQKHIVAVLVDDRWVAQDDLLVQEQNFVPEVAGRSFRLFKIPKGTRWPHNRVPFVIESPLDRETVLAAVEMFKKTNVSFVERTNESDYVVFRRYDKGRCLSNLGYQGGEQEILIDPKVCGTGSIAHEMMHTLGFFHEQCRADRDDFLTVHWEHIERVAYHQFQKIDAEASLVAHGPFDFESVLLYPPYSFSQGDKPSLTLKDGSLYTVNRSNLSDGDVKKINQLYPLPLT